MNDHQDLESRLSRALHSEADRATTDPAALALIRQRTSAAKKAGAGNWLFRPAVAGAALAFTLVIGTLAGVNMAKNNGNTDVVAEPGATAFAVDQSDRMVAPQAPVPADAEERSAKQPQGGDAAGAPMSTLADPAAEADSGESTESSVALKSAPTEEQRKANVPADTGGIYVAIFSPESGSTVVGRAVELRGKARAFEANVIIEISQNGKVLQRTFTTASAGAPELGEWTKVVTLEPGNYRVDAFQESMEGTGEKQGLDSIWITVADGTQGSAGEDVGQGADPAAPVPSEPVASPALDPASGPVAPEAPTDPAPTGS